MLCLVPPESWIFILNTDSIFVRLSINLHVNGASVKAKRHLVTRNQLSDWPGVFMAQLVTSTSGLLFTIHCKNELFQYYDMNLRRRTSSLIF